MTTHATGSVVADVAISCPLKSEDVQANETAEHELLFWM